MQVLGPLRTFARLDAASRSFAAVAWVLAPPVGILLRVVGFERLSPLIGALPVSPRRTRGSAVDVERGEALVGRVFARSLIKPGCLPQSVVQCLVHRLSGREVDLVIGVRKPGRVPHEAAEFEAHAWVEERRGEPRDGGHAELWRSARE